MSKKNKSTLTGVCTEIHAEMGKNQFLQFRRAPTTKIEAA